MRFSLIHRRSPRRRLQFDPLEVRTLLSASPADLVLHPTYLLAASGGPSPAGYSPATIQHAYGFDQVALAGGAAGTGAGQTIAIVDAYDDPNIANDLTAFDQQFGLPAPPSFSKVYASGTAPATNTGWSTEISLDVEWAHAIAPAANLVLVEARSANDNDLMSAVDKARNLSGVSVISMSWGTNEFSGETSDDSHFLTPTGHQGITFVASSGDNAAPGLWPAFSPNVLSVGGTSLDLSNGNYSSETAWSGSGGGTSQYEPEPSYQQGVQSSGFRDSPDVAYDADPQTGFSVYDSVGTSNPWQVVGGTSAAAPQWAGLIAIADQGRALLSEGSLDGAQSAVYQLPATDFHDIVGGSNGFPATAGYDLATGLGTPLANLVIPGLIGSAVVTPAVGVSGGSGQTATVGQAFAQSLELSVVDQNGKPLPGVAVTFSAPQTGASVSFPNGATATTDGNGQVNEPVVAGTVAGSYYVSASVAGVSVPVAFSLTNEAGTPASIAVTAGNAQQSTVGNAFQAVTVLIEDKYGNAVPGATVNFAVPSSGASASLVSGATAVSNSQGQVSESLTANTVAGSYNATASVTGVSVPVVFQLTNLPGAAANVTASAGAAQQATVATAFTQALQVTVTDRYGNPVPGATVTFSQPLTGASAVFGGSANVVTDNLGIASESLTANDVAGTYNLVGSVSGVATPATFALDNEPGAPATITATSGSGQQVVIGASFAQSLSVLVTDQFGNPVPGVVVTYSAPTTGTSAILSGGGQAITDSAGDASLSIAANEQAGEYVVAATLPGVGAAANFSLANGASPASTTSVGATNAIVPLPTSSVAPLAAVSMPTFTVSWSGDDSGGPGIAGYNVLVSDNSGDYSTWLSDTMQTSASFPGVLGHTYSFIVIASDALGNHQPMPDAAQATTAAIAKDANGLYVAAVYQQVLGRLPDEAGINYWTSQLDSTTPEGMVAASIVHSAEYYANEVIRPAYLKYLGRVADDAGVAWWTTQLQSGMSDEQFEAGLAASAEFYSLSGGNDAAWIAALYQALLGQKVDAATQAALEDQLAAGATRGQIALSLATGQQHEVIQIVADYQHYLHRAPDSPGLTYWLGAFSRGQTDEDLITGFVGSQEFYNQVS
jgi:hypothetical protein